MAPMSLGLGILLIALGLIGYFASAAPHWTALLPAAFGAVFFLLGLVGTLRADWRKHTGHAAAALAVLGFLGTARGLGGLVDRLRGAEVARPAAVVSQSVMAILCLVFVAFAVKSFVDARRRSP